MIKSYQALVVSSNGVKGTLPFVSRLNGFSFLDNPLYIQGYLVAPTNNNAQTSLNCAPQVWPVCSNKTHEEKKECLKLLTPLEDRDLN